MTIEQEYEYLDDRYGFGTTAFRMLYEHFNQYVFCKDNRKQIIMDYLILEDFAEKAKEVDFVYYYGIDEFLKEYHDAVYNCIKIDF